MSVQCPDCYDTPIDECGICHGTGFVICSFPDCGCDGARLCQANDPNEEALNCNVEGMWSGNGPEQRRGRMKLYGLVLDRDKSTPPEES